MDHLNNLITSIRLSRSAFWNESISGVSSTHNYLFSIFIPQKVADSDVSIQRSFNEHIAENNQNIAQADRQKLRAATLALQIGGKSRRRFKELRPSYFEQRLK